jgi:uncharacterized protein (DUF427 family)
MSTQTNTLPAPAVEGAIANPSNPKHFMVLKSINRRVRIFTGDRLIADTTGAMRLVEIGNAIYDPLVYVPAADLCQNLNRLEKTSLCPLKGEAAYFAFDGEEIGWAYPEPFDFAEALRGYHSFWPNKVRVEEGE